MLKKISCLIMINLLCVFSIYSNDLIGEGYGATREEARANAIYSIKTQIIVEQESYTEIKTVSKNNKFTDSFSMLITEYSRELPLEKIIYDDVEDKSKDYGENWFSRATIKDSTFYIYLTKLKELSKEITTINDKIINDSSNVKNIEWQKTLLDLCYDFLNYRVILNQLKPDITEITDLTLPISLNRVKLEYNDLIKRQKNEKISEISSLSLLLANGNLDASGIEKLGKLQNEYLELTSNIDILNGVNRGKVDYSTFEYTSNKLETASDYLLRIEANRKAFNYYRESPMNFDDKLNELAGSAISDLNKISETVFNTTSENEELSFEILKYSSVNEGWIARANILLGEKTIQFSFLIPYEEFVGNKYFEQTFARWDKLLMEDPEKYIKLNISYNVKGSFIGNEYGFVVKSLSIDKINDFEKRTGEMFYKAANKNPKTIIFNYGTSVNFGDLGMDDQANMLRAKANKDTNSAEKPDFYFLTQFGGYVGYPIVIADLIDDYVDVKFNYNGHISGELGFTRTNEKEGLDKEIYGLGLKLSYSFLKYKFTTDTYSYVKNDKVPSVKEIGLSFFKSIPFDGTLDYYIKTYGVIGYGFAFDPYFYFDFGTSNITMKSEKMSILMDIAFRVSIGSYVEFGFKPNIGISYVL